MFKVQFILIFLRFLAVSSYKAHQSDAILNVINELYIKPKIQFKLIIFGESTKKLDFLANEISNVGYAFELPLNILKIRNFTNWSYQVANPTIVLIKSIKTAATFLKHTNLSNLTPKVLKFLLYIEDEDGMNLRMLLNGSKLFYLNEGKILDFTYFLLNERKNLYLGTFEWFTEQFCREISKFQMINKYNKKSKRWIKNLKIIDKYKNFHNCTINVYVHPKYEGFRNETFEGFTPSFARIIAKIGNFTPKFLLPPNDNETEEGKPHVCFSQLSTASMKFHPHHVTSAYGDLQLIFIINSLPEYTNWEKVLLPFDFDTWIFLIITFAAAFSIIFVVNPLPHYFKNLAFGKEVQTPAFNVVSIFFGIGQTRLPKGNFPRIVLMFFILFCLVIRTAYQGVLFEMMTTVMKTKPPETIRGCVEMNYTFVMPGKNSSKPLVKLFKDLIKDAKIELYINQSTDKYFLNNSKRYAVMSTKIEERISSNKSELGAVQLKERFLSSTVGIGMLRNSFMFELTEKVTKWLICGGIPQQLFKLYLDMRYPAYEPDGSEPKVLAIEDLDFGFVIWLVACGISGSCFLVEVFTRNIRKWISVKIIAKFVATFVIFVYYKKN